MALIKTFDQLREFVKFTSTSTPAAGMVSTIAAELKYVQPIIGNTLYNTLNAAVAANNVPDDHKDLLTLCRAVAAPLTIYHNQAFLQLVLTDTGFKKVTSDEMGSASRWEYMELKEALLDQGSLAIESLITYLVANSLQFERVNAKLTETLFKTGEEFSEFFFLHQPHRSFISLRPIIKEAEGKLANMIGLTFLTELMTNPEPDINEKAALDLAKTFAVNFTINKALEKLSVAITPQGFTVLLMAAKDQPHDGKKGASDSQLMMLHTSTKLDAKLSLGNLKTFLNSTATANVFATYFNSDKYVNPALPIAEARNSSRTGLFGL